MLFLCLFFFKHVLLYLSLLINSAEWLFSAKYCTKNLSVISQNIVVVLIFIILFFRMLREKSLELPVSFDSCESIICNILLSASN